MHDLYLKEATLDVLLEGEVYLHWKGVAPTNQGPLLIPNSQGTFMEPKIPLFEVP